MSKKNIGTFRVTALLVVVLFLTAGVSLAEVNNEGDPNNLIPASPSAFGLPNNAKEVLSLRTSSAYTFSLGGHKFAAVSSVVLPGAASRLLDIHALPKDSSFIHRGYDFESIAANFRAFFRGDSQRKWQVRFESGQSYLETSLVNNELGRLHATRGFVKDRYFYYPRAYDGVDVRYSISHKKLLEEFIIPSFERVKDLKSLTQEIHAANAKIRKETDGSISFLGTKNSQVLWTLPVPVMYELNNESKNIGAANYGLHYELVQKGSHVYLLKKVLDPTGQAWLSEKNRKFPVVIDASVGPNNGNGASFVEGTELANPNNYHWQNITSAAVLDGAGAWSWCAGGANTQYLKALNFGFSLPTSITIGINGIVVNMVAYNGQSFSGSNVLDNSIKIIKNGTPIGTDQKRSSSSPWSNVSYTTITYGTSTNPWGVSWATSDINGNANFGVAISGIGDDFSTASKAIIDNINITVYYTQVYFPPLLIGGKNS